MDRGHEGLVGTNLILTDAINTAHRFHGGDGVAVVVGGGAIPLAVGAQVIAPNIIPPTIDDFELGCFVVEAKIFAVSHFDLFSGGSNFYLTGVDGALGEVNLSPGSPHEGVGHGVGVEKSEIGEYVFRLVLLAIAIGIAEEKHLRAVRDVATVFIGKNALGNRESVGPNAEGAGGGLGGIIQNENLVGAAAFQLIVALHLGETGVGVDDA